MWCPYTIICIVLTCRAVLRVVRAYLSHFSLPKFGRPTLGRQPPLVKTSNVIFLKIAKSKYDLLSVLVFKYILIFVVGPPYDVLEAIYRFFSCPKSDVRLWAGSPPL